MLYEVDWAEDGTYRYGEKNSPEKFFNDCLENSNEFDLQLGYFSSATISVLSDGFATFISKGGVMRLVINHIVSEEDKKAIGKGINGDVIDCFDLSDFELLRQTFDEYQQQFFECLAFLINNKRIDIRIVRPRNKKGISHTKSGQFRDGDSVTSFTGSANFTISGLFNNIEEIKIDRSDSVDRMVQNRITRQREEFDAIMFYRKRNIEYLSPENLVSAIKSNFGDKDIEDLINVEQQLRMLKKERKYQKWKEKNNMVCEASGEEEPHFPYPQGPREYQSLAFEKWKDNGQKGLFAMATGTGKTITALNCLLEIYKRNGYYKALILVPTITLVEQWEKECQKFNFNKIIKVCSNNNNWKSSIANLTALELSTDNTNGISYIIISTYSSFAKSSVFVGLNQFPKNKLLFVADEAHNMGSGEVMKRLSDIVYLRRIGLSATPERQFDEEGNRRLMDFFGCSDEYTFEYTMAEAINNGALCKYYYYPHIVRLTDTEMSEYMDVTMRIVRMIGYTDVKSKEILKNLLLKRKRIIHKAENKKEIFKKIIEERFEKNGSLKYTLVYVPEGNKPDNEDADIFDKTDYMESNAEDEHLIDQYTAIIRDIDRRIVVRQFTSESSDRDEMLRDFAEGSLHVLTSMKCLDEGVDVPRSEFAIFCSSTGNPRQFVQRRGRVLRTHPDKQNATIHDLIVLPYAEELYEGDLYSIEKSMVEGEIRRVRDFALLSRNCHDSIKELGNILDMYNISIFE